MNEKNREALNRLLGITKPRKLRRTVTKLFFTANKDLLSPQDEEEVYFLIDFLNNINRKKPKGS